MSTADRQSRRWFVGASAVSMTSAALSARSFARVPGANERVRFGLIGFGLIGRMHARTLLKLDEAQLAAVSDVYEPRRDACRELVPDINRHADFRALLDDGSLDAVIVATPDHWHALQTMLACAAGRDVLVEKPLHLFVGEGEWMQQVAAKHRRVVQVGTQQRSGPHYQTAKQLLRDGAIGDIVCVQCEFVRNIRPGIGRPPDSSPPPGFDWDAFLGPAPMRPYNSNRGLYHFRWFWDTSGGQMTNLGHHSLDIVHWVFDLPAPRAVYSTGGRWFLDDNGETPDTQHAIIEYDKFPVIVQIREAAAGGQSLPSGGLVFVGTRGTMKLSRDGFEIQPDRKLAPENAFASINGGGHPVGGPQPVADPGRQYWCAARSEKSDGAEMLYVHHARNFIDCIRSRATPASDLASSHAVSTACHLANISLRLNRRLAWDHAAGTIRNDPEAAAMLERSYRAPWDQELRALLS
jgi:predicted dehydrogenase